MYNFISGSEALNLFMMIKFNKSRFTNIPRVPPLGKDNPKKRFGESMKLPSAIAALIFYTLLTFPVCAYPLHLPSSVRSQEAIIRVRPLLEDELIEHGVKWGAAVYIRIFKKEKLLELWVKQADRFILLKSYEVCNYGPNGLGPKVREGDKCAPEGFYFVTRAGLNPNSSFYLSFNIGYPNQYDKAHGWTGGSIMVHGRCQSWGCFALSDEDIEEVYALVDAGLRHGQSVIPIHIFPFRMTHENMRRYQGHLWEWFWKNLKVGYDLFEQNGFRPPQAMVHNKKYVFRQYIDGGYDFDRASVHELNGYIKAVAWFIPDEKEHFRQYFNNNLFNVLKPYAEEYHLMIEPVNQEYIQHMLVVRDRYGRALEVVIKEKNEWQPIECVPSAMRHMFNRVMTYHFKK
jgi:murein L,D-transpeptidase YafK